MPTVLSRIVLIAGACFLLACGGGNGGPGPERIDVRAPEKGQTQSGKASWYGGKFHGRKTASGERFNKHQLTAAHRKLPFGTRVRVTNLGNGKSVVVRINDRGPFGNRGRIIDVSEAAAEALGMIQSGVARIEIEVLSRPQD